MAFTNENDQSINQSHISKSHSSYDKSDNKRSRQRRSTLKNDLNIELAPDGVPTIRAPIEYFIKQVSILNDEE